jgi:hypothetical protein
MILQFFVSTPLRPSICHSSTSTIMCGWALLAIPSTSQNTELAWELITIIATPEINTISISATIWVFAYTGRVRTRSISQPLKNNQFPT